MAKASFPLLRPVALLAALFALVGATAHGQGYGDGFDPNTDSNVFAMVRQPDGKVIIGGSFTLLEQDHLGQTVTRQRLARLNRDGSVDTTFTAYTDGDVTAIALQPDGRIVVAGKFQVAGDASVAHARTGIARFNADGTFDVSFVQVNPTGFGYFPQAIIRAVAVQPDGRILIGGAFTALQPEGASAPIARSRIARLNTDGTVDTTFSPAANNLVLSILIEPDGNILLGGGFTTIRPTGGSAAIARQRLARLAPDGTLVEAGFPAFDDRVLALARQADGRLLVGGEFSTLTPAGSTTARNTAFIARLGTDGAHDTTFNPLTSAAVDSIAVQADGRILIAGRFTWVRGTGTSLTVGRSYIARLFVNGSLDSDFAPNPNAPVTCALVQPDNTVVFAGYFTGLNSGFSTEARRGRVARVFEDGSVDVAFRVNKTGSVLAVATEADGSLLVAGNFGSLGGVTRYAIARVSPTGAIASDFRPDFNGAIAAVHVLPDGRILVGGSFTRVNGEIQRYVARLNADGTRDATFNPNPNAAVLAIARQADGRILLGGNFTTLQPNATGENVIRRYFARVESTGAVDTGFDPNPNLTVNSIAVQSDNKILAGGDFFTLQPNGARRAASWFYVVRLNTDGTPDESFLPRPNAAVSRVLLQPDGKIMITGAFNALLPGTATESTARRNIARLNADGTIDTAFDAGPNGNVANVELLPGGRYLVHGSFQLFHRFDATVWTERPFLAWLNADGTLDATRMLRPDTQLSLSRALPDGSALLAGPFTRLTDGGGSTTIVRDLLVRVTPDAQIDPAFSLAPESLDGAFYGALATEVGGRIYAAGSFDGLGGTANTNIARLLPDGQADSAFSAKADGVVHAVSVFEASDDEEVIGGPVAWLEAGGEPRDSFSQEGSTKISGSVFTLAVQPDNKVLVGGEFTSSATTNSSPNLVRLNADGTFDTTFIPNPNASVQAVALLSDGRILIGGSFTEVGGTTHRYLARLNANGSLDTTWAPTPNGVVLSIVPLANGKVMIGGAFTALNPNGATTAVNRPYAALLNADGTVDTTFDAQLNNTVNRIAVQPDGRIILAGAFTNVRGTVREYLARVNANGTLDTGFHPKPNGIVERLALHSSGWMMVAGEFNRFNPGGSETAVSRSLLARIQSDGSVDPSFRATPNSWIEEIALLNDGSVVVGGSFTGFQLEEGGDLVRRNYIARFSVDGTLDPLFNPNANGSINTLLSRPDNSLVIGGFFTRFRPPAAVIVAGEFENISDSPTPFLARLNNDGSADAFFTPRPDAPVRALGEQADGRVIAGGDFTTMQPAGAEAPIARTRLARLTTLGALDEDFAPVIDGAVHAVHVLPDDRIVIGGDFTSVDGASRTRLARLAADGTVDAGFTASADGIVSAITRQADGRLLVAGAFTQVNGTARAGLARLAADGTLDAAFAPAVNGAVHSIAVQADGRIFIAGAFTTVGGQPRARVARLLASGALDTSFTADADDTVHALLLTNDGRLVAAGAFSEFAGRRALLIGRVANATPVVQTATLSNDLSTFTWTPTGASPVYSHVEIATSVDGRTWTNAGVATATGAGAWQLAGLTGLEADAFNFLRARAVHTTAPGGSIGRFEISWQFFGSTPAGPATLLNSGGAQAGWTNGTGGGSGSGGDGSGGSGGGSSGGGSGGGSGGDGSGGSGGGAGGGAAITDFHLTNLSIRAWPEEGQAFIAGLVLRGDAGERVLLRAVGPGLEAFGVDPAMSAPRLAIYNSAGDLLASSSSWSGDATVATVAAEVGAFPLLPESDDSAVVHTLEPGAYTIHVHAGSGLNGIALGEIYFAGAEGGLANFSARAKTGAGTAVCIAGFVVGGDQPRTFLVRGVGPALAGYGVADASTDTTVRVYDGDGVEIAFNDDWEQQAGSATAVAEAAARTGAFALPAGAKDAALLIELPPGNYTVHVGGSTAGTVLAEVYEVLP